MTNDQIRMTNDQSAGVASLVIRASSLGHSVPYSSAKFLRIRSPSAWLFSG